MSKWESIQFDADLRKSWDTITTPPSYALIAIASASMDSMSKWFVGSSDNLRLIWRETKSKGSDPPSKRIWGCSMASWANTTLNRQSGPVSRVMSNLTYRFRRPSESCLIGAVWWAPDKPKRPSWERHAWKFDWQPCTYIHQKEIYHNILLRELLGEKTLEVLDRWLIVRQLIGGVLGVFGEFERGMLRYCPCWRLERAGNEMQESRFSCTVST